MAKKWLELGVLIKNTNKKDGTPIPVNEQKFQFKLSDEAYEALRKAGFEISQWGQLQTPIEEVEGLIKAGVITEDKVESRRQTAKDANKWLRYKVQLPPPRVDE